MEAKICKRLYPLMDVRKSRTPASIIASKLDVRETTKISDWVRFFCLLLGTIFMNGGWTGIVT